MTAHSATTESPKTGQSLAAWRWGFFVTAFLVAQLGLAYAAVTAANSDGGARAIPGAEAEIAKSYEQLNTSASVDHRPTDDQPSNKGTH